MLETESTFRPEKVTKVEGMVICTDTQSQSNIVCPPSAPGAGIFYKQKGIRPKKKVSGFWSQVGFKIGGEYSPIYYIYMALEH